MRRAALVFAFALATAAAPARAAYDPHFAVRVDPATPDTAPALTATITQAAGERATQSEHVRFPPQFGFNPDLRVARCTSADEHAGHCPDASRIGNAAAQTMLGDFAGPVYLTSDFRFVTFLRGFGGLVQQEVSGYLVLLADGSVESVLEGLPDIPATMARIAFDAGPRSLILTPRTCGTYTIAGQFTSHAGERADRAAPVQIAGCDSRPRIAEANAVWRRGRLTVSWRLSEAGSATVVEVQRMTRTARFVRWRRVRLVRAGAAAGANRVTLRVGAGRYQVVVRALSTRGRPTDVARLPV